MQSMTILSPKYNYPAQLNPPLTSIIVEKLDSNNSFRYPKRKIVKREVESRQESDRVSISKWKKSSSGDKAPISGCFKNVIIFQKAKVLFRRVKIFWRETFAKEVCGMHMQYGCVPPHACAWHGQPHWVHACAWSLAHFHQSRTWERLSI